MPVRKSSRFRPFLEQLEDRLTPTSLDGLSNATVGQAYSAQIKVNGYLNDNFTFTVQSASVPTWMSISPSGKITGTPDAAGIVELHVTGGVDNTNSSGSFSSLLLDSFDIFGPNNVLTLTPNSLPAGTVGTSYNQSFTVSGDANVTFGENGPLPAGLSMSSNGVLSGTPTQAGTFNIIVTAYDQMAGATGSVAMPLVINPLITVSPSNDGLTPATANYAYSQQFSASGGSGSYNYSANLPSGLGLTFSNTGFLSGTPTQTGTFPFTVTAADANGDGNTGAASYVLNVVAPITFTPAPLPGNNYVLLPSGTVNQPYKQSIAVSNNSGSATLSYDLMAGGLPAGLSAIESNDRKTLTIEGTPTQAGREYYLVVTAADGNAKDTTTVTYYLTINAPPVPIQIGPASPPNGTVGSAYRVQLTGSGGSGPYTYTPIASANQSDPNNGGLPPGLTLNKSSGLISGTPTTAGTYNFIVKITDNAKHTDTAVEQVTIVPQPGTLYLTDSPLPLSNPGVPYSQTITAVGGKGATVLSYTLKSSLAPGLQITLSPDKSKLTISGTATKSAPLTTLTVTATDSAGETAQQTYYPATMYSPAQIAQAYGINNILLGGGIKGDGAGQTIAVIDMGDAPNLVSSTDPNYRNSDLARFDAYFGLPDPPSFLKLDQYGGANYSSYLTDDAAEETTMDIDYAHALAPKANIILMESYNSSPHNINNLDAAIQTALSYPGVTVISFSIGQAEVSSVTNTSALLALNANATFVASSGDNGHHVISPSSAPNALAVGETLLTIRDPQGDYGTESGVTSSGGTASQFVLQQPWQQLIDDPVSGTMRTTPDVAFNGDPSSGTAVYNSYDHGQGMPWEDAGGTSLAAPSWAALIAIINQGRAAAGEGPLGTQTAPALYHLAGTADFHSVGSITVGVNLSPAYQKYNPWSGLGTPVANLLVPDLVGGQNIISGTVYAAASGAAMPGITVYLDAAGKGRFVQGDPTTVTDAKGSYQFLVAPGTGYQVRIIAPAGYVQATATPAALSFAVGSATASGVNFGLSAVSPPPAPTDPALTANEPILFGMFEQLLEDIETTDRQALVIVDQLWSNWLLILDRWLGNLETTIGRIEAMAHR